LIPPRRIPIGEIVAREDSEIVASQLADLTRAVEKLAAELEAVRSRADNAQERADTQQERIDLAARELGEVSARLQAAADALRESL
jgi:outer membrane murein-binding lipoprotein Lpp